jgi:putative hemolysin
MKRQEGPRRAKSASFIARGLVLLFALQALTFLLAPAARPEHADSPPETAVAAAQAYCRAPGVTGEGRQDDGAAGHCALCWLRDDEEPSTTLAILGPSSILNVAPRVTRSASAPRAAPPSKRETLAGGWRSRAPPSYS